LKSGRDRERNISLHFCNKSNEISASHNHRKIYVYKNNHSSIREHIFNKNSDDDGDEMMEKK
jgi:hypothetical protein